MVHKNYYRILGVQTNATPGEIRSAFRRLARKHHPDLNPGDPQAEARFKEINEAHEVLGDPVKRGEYDRRRAAGRQVRPPARPRPAPSSWERRLSHLEAGQDYLRWVAGAVGIGLGLMLLTSGAISMGWASILVLVVMALAGGLGAIGWGLYASEQTKCPRCHRAQGVEELRRDTVGIFKKSAYSPFGSRNRQFFVVPHVKYRLHYRCRQCGHRWLATVTRKL